MDKYIKAVEYRHLRALPTAYLKIVGRTLAEAEGNAKRVGTILLERMPKSAEVRVPRYRGYDREERVESFEIPIINGCDSTARAELARLVLQGRVDGVASAA